VTEIKHGRSFSADPSHFIVRCLLGLLLVVCFEGCSAPEESTTNRLLVRTGGERTLITANVIHRVFRIRYGQQAATAFAIDIDGRQYLITAKHVVAPINGKERLGIFANGAWTDLPVQLVGHSTDADISVLATDRRLTPSDLPLEPTSAGLVYSQEVLFLGFPYDILSTYIFEGEGFPLPLVKKAIVSSFVNRGTFLLDGHNNPGFSGGPVVFVRPGEKDLKVAAVISGYQAVNEPVFAGDQKAPLVYRYNTGIIVAYSIDHAVTLIRSNPIGFKL
jgi:S1-C subfamily serine protease